MRTLIPKSILHLLLVLCLSISLGPISQASAFPQRPINLIVPYKTGGGTDLYARALAVELRKVLNVPVVVVNRPGGSGIVGAVAAAKSPADGHTLLVASAGSLLLSSMLKPLPVNLSDFQLLGQVGRLTPALMVPADSAINDVGSLVAMLKQNPGKLRWSHPGRGGVHHTAGRAFLYKNDLQARDVPFSGGAPARSALISEQVGFAVIGIQQAFKFESLIKPVALLATGRDRVQTAVPSLQETGLEFADLSSPIVVLAPGRTAAPIVNQLVEALNQAVLSPDYTKALHRQGMSVFYAGPQEASARLTSMEQENLELITDLKK
ncbi:tripartite tricarboxylate transporter substrate binding protein [Motiliproteus coralliicola]|uniref:Tripartite tricarboxylate transporter substrate binding protein n=1 Tax=Motiliproteus coralliicola TaxID=2283196 RepID=A0A369WUA2_9GAMM|nr:tripartite tricarboxylate transporter substrate binding protein [Motiliproteus coralliicola]RDE24639.1 tripartite tricarboxylate transporter substrate binding protein [Motiliproteus coralliicola]